MCNLDFFEKFSKAMLKRNKGVALMVNLAAQEKQDILNAYYRTKAKYSKVMFANMRQFVAGNVSLDEYLSKQKNIIRSCYTDSFSLGKYFGSGGALLTSDEKNFITFQTTQEMKFMENFANDIMSRKGKMPYARRMKMYIDGLDGMFGFGKLVYLPEEVQIYWMLGRTDKHCIDCLMFSSKNPYTKKTLPGFPKSGQSKCLSNCRCALSYVFPSNRSKNDYDDYILKNHAENKNIPTEDEYNVMMGHSDDYYYNRLMYEITKDKTFITAAGSSLQALKTFQTSNNFKITRLPVATAIKDVRQMNKLSTFGLVEDVTELNANEFVSFFSNGELRYGKVTKVLNSAVSVRTIENVTYDIVQGKAIIFREGS